jgi:Tfp pilus assembly protein PilO
MRYNKAQLSTKRIQISRANAVMFGSVIATSIIVVFGLFSLNALISQSSYNNKVINARSGALKTLKDNVVSANSLKESYVAFNNAPESVLGTKDRNSKIVLDSLPSKYDFPALTASIEKITSVGGYTIESISGDDAEIIATKSSATASPIAIPINLVVKSNYDAAKKLSLELERSIRPFNVKKIEITGSDQGMRVSSTLETYYQPEKRLEITKKVIK